MDPRAAHPQGLRPPLLHAQRCAAVCAYAALCHGTERGAIYGDARSDALPPCDATPELQGLMRVPNASMGSHRMHGCSMGSVGRQTAAWVHGLRAMRAMPCVSCMHHHEAHSRPTPSNTPQHMLMPTHALARHASRGVCQQLWLRMRRPEALCNSSCQTVEWPEPLNRPGGWA